jgi:ABC-type lipoprotein export system ATPase subunit
MLSCRGIRVSYGKGEQQTTPLRELSLEVDERPCVVMGPSGSGKTTLLRVLAGLQAPDAGTVELDGREIAVGTATPGLAMIHQDYRLVDFLTVEENLQLAAEMRGLPLDGAAVTDTLELVGLGGLGGRWPTTLSGGEQQRVAIARALVTDSRVLLADEPTGSLDRSNTTAIGELLLRLSTERGIHIVIATHDPSLAELMPRRFLLADGVLHEAVQEPA